MYHQLLHAATGQAFNAEGVPVAGPGPQLGAAGELVAPNAVEQYYAHQAGLLLGPAGLGYGLPAVGGAFPLSPATFAQPGSLLGNVDASGNISVPFSYGLAELAFSGQRPMQGGLGTQEQQQAPRFQRPYAGAQQEQQPVPAPGRRPRQPLAPHLMQASVPPAALQAVPTQMLLQHQHHQQQLLLAQQQQPLLPEQLHLLQQPQFQQQLLQQQPQASQPAPQRRAAQPRPQPMQTRRHQQGLGIQPQSRAAEDLADPPQPHVQPRPQPRPQPQLQPQPQPQPQTRPQPQPRAQLLAQGNAQPQRPGPLAAGPSAAAAGPGPASTGAGPKSSGPTGPAAQSGPAGPAAQSGPTGPAAQSGPAGPAGPPLRALIDWRATLAASPEPHDVLPPGHPAKGTAGLQEMRLGAFELLLAEGPEAADAAVEVLRSRMWDGIVAMGVECRPESAAADAGPIALLLLSSCGLLVAIRTTAAGGGPGGPGGGGGGGGAAGLPTALRTAILEDSDIELLVPSWGASDERNFEESFGIQTFWCGITELQKVAKACGLPKTGVRALVPAVLEPSAQLPKSKKPAASSWDAPVLNPGLLKQAALDAACTEHVFRCLEGRF